MVAKSGNYKWLQQQDEDILEPELPIIDPHHHLWDKNDQLIVSNKRNQEIMKQAGINFKLEKGIKYEQMLKKQVNSNLYIF